MPDFSTYIDIDPSEYIDECSRSEIEELIEILIDNGHLDGTKSVFNKHHNLLDEEWNNIIEKLVKGRVLLSNEDENMIKQIANKLI
jgi:hypothetical protein